LWDTFKRHFGGDSDRLLVAQAPSRTMNPNLPQRVIDDAMADDPEAARAEYLAEFRGDISTFLDLELIERAIRPKPLELLHSTRETYFAFVDPAGGGADEFTLAIGHMDGQTIVCDMVRGRRGSPAEIAKEFGQVMLKYGITTVHGDRYAGRWPRDEFLRWGITYQTSDLDRSGLYLEFLARLNSGSVELPPDPVLQRQLIGLERRTSRAGRDTIDHGPGAHDDRANAIAGLVTIATKPRAYTVTKSYKF
jgi:hypothetical protein